MSEGMHTLCLPNLDGSHLSGAGLAADNSHFVALPLSHCFSEFAPSSAVVAHLAHSVHMTVQRGVPFVGVMKKSQFQWRTHELPVHWFFKR